MPSLSNGTVLVEPGGNKFLALGGRLRAIPDAQTAMLFGRKRVANLQKHDALSPIFQKFQGEPLQSVGTANKETIAIDAYIRSLGPLPAALPTENSYGVLYKRLGVTQVDGVDMEITEQVVTMRQEVRDFVEISQISDVMWAGATVAGESVQSGSLAPILLRRGPGTITLTTDLTTASTRSKSLPLKEPNLPSYVDAHNQLIDELHPTDSAAAVNNRIIKINTLEEGMVSFGLNVKGSGWGVNAKARLDSRLERSVTFGMFSQAYYAVAFTPQGSPPRFFGDDVRLDEVKQYCGVNNPPCYIASVTYGRTLMFMIDSESSNLEVTAALDGYWKAGISGEANVEGSYKNTMNKSKVSVVVIGGPSGASGQVISDPANGLLPWIMGALKITKDVPAAPVSYTVRYLAPPHHMVVVNRTTAPMKIVDANVYGGRQLQNIYSVGEGPGSGSVATGIRLNRGDKVTITATGSIWAGWTFLGRNGPEGLNGPPKPWYPLPTGEGVQGSMLIAGYDNTDWFPVGSGCQVTVPPENDGRELWLRLNDEDMTNGNGAFEVKVSLERREPIINAKG
jgi:hypothetical protein